MSIPVDLETRLANLEERVAKLERKANPTLYQRCKGFLRSAGGNFPKAIVLATAAGDKEAVKRLENEMERMD